MSTVREREGTFNREGAYLTAPHMCGVMSWRPQKACAAAYARALDQLVLGEASISLLELALLPADSAHPIANIVM